MEEEHVLLGNAREYWKNALLAEQNKEYNTSVTLFFKTLSALSDIYILRKEKQMPSSHANRFRILETKYPDIYRIIDKDFPFYQNSYFQSMSKEIAEAIKDDTKIMAKKAEIKL